MDVDLENPFAVSTFGVAFAISQSDTIGEVIPGPDVTDWRYWGLDEIRRSDQEIVAKKTIEKAMNLHIG